ncbi:hypothetical protein FKG94_23105 [Exilibacterium tricleocarpae]|uniref:Uncharacterized protein n=1 Tax=Exilibacterium tricleocarpae TaxID=2591008 RepID=A0A545SXJ4_9GAMM|nr:hypothetical protein [Exilibacterium tricleocarpae]TQV69684.1 hypothetical protein FKG94_23105 [Exilibacterium tricleocarpae]
MNENEPARDNPEHAPSSKTEEVTLIECLQDISSQAKNSLASTAQLAQAEWQLSMRALWLVAASTMFLSGLILVVWVSLNAALAYWAYTSDVPVTAIAAGFVVVQLALITWLWTQVQRLLALIGFPRTLNRAGENNNTSVSQQRQPT